MTVLPGLFFFAFHQQYLHGNTLYQILCIVTDRNRIEPQSIKMQKLTKAALLSENRLCDRGEGSMALLMMICAAISGASGTMSGAGFTVGTADALHSAPLFLPDVPNCEADNQCNNRNYDDVIHKTAPLKKITSSVRTQQPGICWSCGSGKRSHPRWRRPQSDRAGSPCRRIRW